MNKEYVEYINKLAESANLWVLLHEEEAPSGFNFVNGFNFQKMAEDALDGFVDETKAYALGQIKEVIGLILSSPGYEEVDKTPFMFFS